MSCIWRPWFDPFSLKTNPILPKKQMEAKVKSSRKFGTHASDIHELKRIDCGPCPRPRACPDYKIDPENTRVYVRFAGKLAAADIERYANALRKELSFEPGWSEIVDLRAVEQIDISPDQSIALADTFDPFSLSSRRAFVVANDQQRHAARMQQGPAQSQQDDRHL